MSSIIDRLALKLTDPTNEEGIAFLWSRTNLIVAGLFFLFISLTSWLVGFALICIWVLAAILAHIWVSARGLRKPEELSNNLFNLSADQTEALAKVRAFSASIWTYHHNDQVGERYYTALEEDVIRMDRERVSKLRSSHHEVAKWNDKPLVEAVRLCERYIAKGQVNFKKRQQSFIQYLALSEISGQPLKNIPDPEEIDALVGNIERDEIGR